MGQRMPIAEDPRYRKLIAHRSQFAWWLTAIMLIIYFGFIGLIAFEKSVLATPIGSGVTSLGIPLGLAIIGVTIGLTGIYVYRANNEFDRLMSELLAEHGQ